jgi:hypothetical protein
MATNLPSQSFVALAAVAWADGRMSTAEAAGLSSAAKAAGLEGDELAAVERAIKEKSDIDSFDASGLSDWTRLFTFGVANWLSRLDGVQQRAELDSLRVLAGKLAFGELDDHKLKVAEACAFDVTMLPEGRRPERFDFAALETKLRERFPKMA